MTLTSKDYQEVLEWIERDRDEIVAFLSKLVQCKTPSTVGDTREAVEFIGNYLSEQGIPYETLAHCKTMPNFITSFSGKEAGKHLMLNGHLDVMPAGKEPGWIDDPWSGAIHDNRVWGRGTSDMKAGDTAMIFAYKYLYRLRDKLSGKLSLTLVADEETGWGRGTGYLFDTIPERMMADAVLTGEPSGVNTINFASKGYMMLSLSISTRGAIAGYSNESQNAIEIAAKVIADLKELERLPVTLPSELKNLFSDSAWVSAYEAVRSKAELEQLQKITVDICTIKGGSLSVVIPSDCQMTVSIVFPQGTDVALLEEKVTQIADKYEEVNLRIDGVDLPDMSDRENELPEVIQEMAEQILHQKPLLVPDIAISDCRYWRYKGIPAYWYGPGGEDCSAANESILIEDLINTVKIHTLTALNYLQ